MLYNYSIYENEAHIVLENAIQVLFKVIFVFCNLFLFIFLVLFRLIHCIFSNTIRILLTYLTSIDFRSQMILNQYRTA